MKNTISSIVKEFIKVVIIVAIAVPTIALFAAWTGPTGAPPTNNADAPVNVSNNPQEKKGDLSIHRTEGGFDVGMFAADKLKILGGAIFNNNSPTDDKKIIINTGGNVGIGTVNPTAKLDIEGNLKFTGQKICSAVESGNWRDTIFVSSSWTAETCRSYMIDTGTHAYQLGCMFENSYSFGMANGGVPSPNCGWGVGMGVFQAQWAASSPGSGWVDTELKDCDFGDGHGVDEDSCGQGGGSGRLYLKM